MNNYDLTKLDSREFEKLCADIIGINGDSHHLIQSN